MKHAHPLPKVLLFNPFFNKNCIMGIITSLIQLAIMVVTIFAGWKTFEKAGQKGWAIIVPIYNLMVMMRIIGKSDWWWLRLLIPIYNIYIMYLIAKGMAKSFGLSDGYTWLYFFLAPIFYIIVAFKEEVKYVAPFYKEEAKQA